MNVHFSSKTDEWETPQELFDKLNEEFKLEVDVCAQFHNTKLAFYWSNSVNGLKQDWKGKRCWMNPPYGREIGKWVKKAAEGGGRDRGVPSSGADRYKMVSRLHSWKVGNKIFERTA